MKLSDIIYNKEDDTFDISESGREEIEAFAMGMGIPLDEYFSYDDIDSITYYDCLEDYFWRYVYIKNEESDDYNDELYELPYNWLSWYGLDISKAPDEVTPIEWMWIIAEIYCDKVLCENSFLVSKYSTLGKYSMIYNWCDHMNARGTQLEKDITDSISNHDFETFMKIAIEQSKLNKIDLFDHAAFCFTNSEGEECSLYLPIYKKDFFNLITDSEYECG